MKSIWSFFSQLWLKEPIQLLKKEEDVQEKENVQEKEDVQEKEVIEEKKEYLEEDNYTLELKNPNIYTSFEEKNVNIDDIEIYNLKEKRKIDEVFEDLKLELLDELIQECTFTS